MSTSPPENGNEYAANVALELYAALGAVTRELAESRAAMVTGFVQVNTRLDAIDVRHAKLASRLGLVEASDARQEDTLSEMKQLAPEARRIIRSVRWRARWRKRLIVTAILAAVGALGAGIGTAVGSKLGLAPAKEGHP